MKNLQTGIYKYEEVDVFCVLFPFFCLFFSFYHEFLFHEGKGGLSRHQITTVLLPAFVNADDILCFPCYRYRFRPHNLFFIVLSPFAVSPIRWFLIPCNECT